MISRLPNAQLSIWNTIGVECDRDHQDLKVLREACWHACYHTGDLSVVKDCLSKGLSKDTRTIAGARPIDASIYGGHYHIFQYLLSIDVQINVAGYGQYTILMAAANQGRPDMLEQLLDQGADPNLASPLTGETPLHAAAAKGFDTGATTCMQLLLAAGADPNQRAKSGVETNTYYRDTNVVGETPLHLAAAYGSEEMIKLLLNYGADPSITDDRGESPLTWFSRHQRTVEHLKLSSESRDLLLYGKWKE